MTKYILVGGYVRNALDGGKGFCQELIKGFEEPVKILDCLFAEDDNSLWPEKLRKDQELLSLMLPDVDIQWQLAQISTFRQQISWADVIYLRGGSAELLLQNIIKEIPDIQKLMEGKTLAGTSAGADVIATFYYGLDTIQIMEGLGLLPIKVIVHWKSDYNAPNIDWNKAYQELQDYKQPLELITLAEGEFRVIEK